MIFGKSKKQKVHPKFDGVELKQVKVMRYLGIMINEKLSNIDHHKSRRDFAIKSSYKLNKIGYNTLTMKTCVKSSLYKCYTRPMLLYGIENTILRQTEKKKYKH